MPFVFILHVVVDGCSKDARKQASPPPEQNDQEILQILADFISTESQKTALFLEFDLDQPMRHPNWTHEILSLRKKLLSFKEVSEFQEDGGE